MKKLMKWIVILIGVLFVFLLAVPFLFKDKIIEKVKAEANNNLNAKFDFKSLSLSLVKKFPNVSISLDELSIINLAPFEGDTLVYAKSFGLTVDLMSVISGEEIRIRTISVEDPVMNFLVDTLERANWDIAKPSSDTGTSQPSSFKASLKKYTINNAYIVYNDASMPFVLRMEGVDHTGSGDFTSELFVLKTNSEIKKADLIYGGVRYISGAQAKLEADIDMDMTKMKFTFKENKILLNDLAMGVDGWLAMPDTNIDMDLSFNAAKSDFKNFLSVVPAMYSGDFKDLKASGKMSLSGNIRGRYNAKSMPGFGIALKIDNGMFQYPSLPSAVKNVFVDLDVSNPDGVPDRTLVNLSLFHMEMNGDALDAKLVLRTPVSDPDIDAFLKGKIDLDGIQKIAPLEKGTSISGIINSDVTIKGRMSSIEQKQYERFMAKGNFGISGMKYLSAEMKNPFVIHNLQLAFNPQRLALAAFNASFGKSDFSATGSINNFLGYALKDEILQGAVNMGSKRIDLNDLMAGDDKPEKSEKADTASASVLEVPANIDFTLNATIESLAFQNLTMNNVKGKLRIVNKEIRMQELTMLMLDGFLSLGGGYSSADIKNPSFDFSVSAKGFDIQKTAGAFASVEKMVPIARHCSGVFSTDMNVKGNLDSKMEPVMNSLTGGGKLTTGTVTVSNFPVFSKIADALKMDSWKRMEIGPVNPSFKFNNGRVYVDPFEMKTNSLKATVAGSNGFDQTIDYTLATMIPRSAFGGAANSVLDNLVSGANAKGANFSLGETVPVNLTVTGTVSDPKIGTDLGKMGANIMEDLKSKVKEELESKVKEETDRLKKEADARIEAEKQKAASEAERLKKEAENKAQARADSLKKAAEKKAKEELKKLNPFK